MPIASDLTGAMMRAFDIGIGVCALTIASSAVAAEYLTEVDSDVIQTTGTQSQITDRAATCIAQNMKSGVAGGQVIVSKDVGTIVANNAFSYSQALMNWKIRSTFTFEAKDGRFRMRHTNIERFINDWGPVGKWSGSKWQGVQTALEGVSASIARCVQNPSQSSNW